MKTIVIVSVFSLSVLTKAAALAKPQIGSADNVKHIVAISTQDAATIFRKVESELVGKTSVPLRWPTFFPYGPFPKDGPLYVNLLSVSREGYSIELGLDKDCIGEGSCHFGTVRGSSAPLVEDEGPRLPVPLQGGMSGYFIDFTCGANCNDAAIGWSENGYHYSISLKAGKKQQIISMVNSAIAVAHKPKH